MLDRLSDTDISVMTGITTLTHNVRAVVVNRRTSKGRGVMAHVASCSGWEVINELANADNIVVARFAIISDTNVFIGASGKGTWGMANTTILIDVDIDDVERHVLVDSREGKR